MPVKIIPKATAIDNPSLVVYKFARTIGATSLPSAVIAPIIGINCTFTSGLTYSENIDGNVDAIPLYPNIMIDMPATKKHPTLICGNLLSLKISLAPIINA